MRAGRRAAGVAGAVALLVAAVWLPAAGGPTPTLAVVVDVADAALRPAFAEVVAEVVGDARGWSAAGASIEVVDEGLHRIGLATSAEMDRACAPYGAASKFACRPGAVGMINVEWWEAPPSWWPGDVASFRRHIVNHELGHLLGIRAHPPCPGEGAPLPVMALPPRESTPCTANAWPTAPEVQALAAALAAESP